MPLDADSPQDGHRELLIFTLDGRQRLALPLAAVREVRCDLATTPLPNAPHAVLGLAQVRGATFPVIDLNEVLGDPRRADPRGAVIVTEQAHANQGLLVERVERIVTVAAAQLNAPPPGCGHRIEGVARIDDELVEILDLEEVLRTVTPGLPGD